MVDHLERLKAALAGRYRIDRELGHGGMAVVYLAEDLRHERAVALKVLRPELALTVGSDRFVREIRLAARLHHPNVLAIYDSGEADGFLYYVMPYVEGESLRDRLERERHLPVEEALRLTREIAAGLDYAHEQGVIHRDVKPGNVLLSGGRVLIADFGVARALAAPGGERLTATGVSPGTPLYMSPEQAVGDQDVDRRTDVYSLACVLYEMLAGEPPFTAPSVGAVMAKHAIEPRPSVRTVRDTVPASVDTAIRTAMAKVPADRYGTASEFVAALVAAPDGPETVEASVPRRRRVRSGVRSRIAGAAALALVVVAAATVAWSLTRSGASSGVPNLTPQQVAVLYFQDRSAAGDLEHYAVGLTEDLIDTLRTVPELDVVSRSGVMPFRGTELPVDSVARALDVQTLVQGAVEMNGGELEVQVWLTDGQTGRASETRTIRYPPDRVLTLRGQLVRDVLALLSEYGSFPPTDRDLAWTLLQRGKVLQENASDRASDGDQAGARAALDSAKQIYRSAYRADTSWVQPIVARGSADYDRAVQVERGRDEVPWLDSAMTAAEEALRLVPGDPRALSLRGRARYRLWSLRVAADSVEQAGLLRRARNDLERALATDSSLADALLTLSDLYYELPVPDVPRAQQLGERAYAADRSSENAPRVLTTLFWTNIDRESLQEAQRWCLEGYRRFPANSEFTRCRLWLTVTPQVPPNVDSAWALRARIDSLTPSGFRRVEAELLVGGVIARAGLTDSARAVLDRAHAAMSREIDPYLQLSTREAYMRTLLGDDDRAINLLEEFAAANPHYDLGQMLGNWWWQKLRADPRFQALLRSDREAP